MLRARFLARSVFASSIRKSIGASGNNAGQNLDWPSGGISTYQRVPWPMISAAACQGAAVISFQFQGFFLEMKYLGRIGCELFGLMLLAGLLGTVLCLAQAPPATSPSLK